VDVDTPLRMRTLGSLLQARVDLCHVVVVGVIPPVAAGLGDRGWDVELLHLAGLLEDVDVHALGGVPCDVAVESWDVCQYKNGEALDYGENLRHMPGLSSSS